jgi:hypothetical protein
MTSQSTTSRIMAITRDTPLTNLNPCKEQYISFSPMFTYNNFRIRHVPWACLIAWVLIGLRC